MDFRQFMLQGFVILDGAFGTELQKTVLTPGEIPELLNITNPEAVGAIPSSYVAAGADVVFANTFGANRFKLQKTEYSVDDVIKAAFDIAKSSGAKFTALDVGPLGRLLEPLGPLSFEEAYDAFSEIVKCGVKYGADLIIIETMTDLYEMKAALLAAKENSSLPVICSLSFDKGGRTFTGCGAREAALTLPALGADAIGINCSTGPEDMYDTVCELLKYSSVPVAVQPNAGMPDPVTGAYSLGADDFASYMKVFAALGARLLGGCCGTTPEYITKMKAAITDVPLKAPAYADAPLTVSSFTKTVECTRPLIVGECINPTGKKALKEALRRDDIDFILKLATEQVACGADILDINVGLPGIDEVAMMVKVVKAVQGITDVPIQIDSSDPAAIEAALRVCRGRPIINSVNGSEESLSAILPLVAKYGAAVVGLTLDENGVPTKAEERFNIAKKIIERAEKYGISRGDIIIDCLTLTVSAEPDSARETLGALIRVKRELGVKTILGVSNISFGLPEREKINSTFLVSALHAGLDFAIINPMIESMSSAVRAYRVLAGFDAGATEYIKTVQHIEPEKKENAEITLASAVEGGMKAESARLTKELLVTMAPLDVVNQKLIPILDSVGERFEKGTLYLPQLIIAADTIGACFAAVKEEMARSNISTGSGHKIILATVKGDIHDIGKSIVKVLLENYGYDVIDLGRDVDPEIVVNSAIEKGVRLIGLSALMTTTLGAMEKTIKLVKERIPGAAVMVGGAVLTADYAASIGADFYAKDAKGSVDVAKKFFGE